MFAVLVIVDVEIDDDDDYYDELMMKKSHDRVNDVLVFVRAFDLPRQHIAPDLENQVFLQSVSFPTEMFVYLEFSVVSFVFRM